MIDINKESEEYSKSSLLNRKAAKHFIAGHNSKATQAKVIQGQIDIVQSLYQHFGADSYMAYLGEKLQQQLKQLENEN
jgi:hypothetical protein